eukprot:tig00021038_g17532.t1
MSSAESEGDAAPAREGIAPGALSSLSEAVGDPSLHASSEFLLLRRQVPRLSQTSQTSFQPFAPLPESLWSFQREPSGRLCVHYPYVVKLRKYKLKAAAAGSPWIGRQLIIDMTYWDTGEVFTGHACSGKKMTRHVRPFVGRVQFETGVDALGETEAFAMDLCRCFRRRAFELRIRDKATDARPAGRIMIHLVRRGGRVKEDVDSDSEPQPPGAPRSTPTSCLPPPFLPVKHAAGDAAPDPPPAVKRPPPPALIPPTPPPPVPTPPPPASPQPTPGTPESPGGPAPTFLPTTQIKREDTVLQEAGYLDSLFSAFLRSPPAENRSSVSELLSSAEQKFWELFVSSETSRLSFRRRSIHDEPKALPPPLRPPEAESHHGRHARPVPDSDVDALFVQLSNLSIDPDAPVPVPISPLSPQSAEPPPPTPSLPPPVPFSPSPYILDPREEDEFMRRVNAAEAAGAASALAVLLGDPRVLGTALFRTPAGRIRTRHLLVLVRIAARSAGPGRARSLFPPPLFDSILRSLSFNLLSGPTSYPSLEEAERACENVWNYVTVVTAEYVLISPDFLLAPLDEVLALHERAMLIAEDAIERFGRDPRAELLLTTAKMRASFSLRQFGHMREALELAFEAWDDLLRLRVYPHRLESEALRDLISLHVHIERTDLARHFAERLYWFEETNDDVEFKVSCLQALAHIDLHEGDPLAAVDALRRAVAICRELVERTGGNAAYALRLGRASKSLGLCELVAGLVGRWGSTVNTATKVTDAVCELTSPEHDDFGLAACAVIFRPDGFKLRHAIRILRTCALHLEWGHQRYKTPHKMASAFYHIGLLCALDGQLTEALELFSTAMAKYTCTPELAACFGDSHPRIRNLRRAAAWVAARLGRPVPPELAAPLDASGQLCGPAAPARRGSRLAPRQSLDPAFWTSRGIDVELQEVFKATYPADTLVQIGAWLANGPG